MCRRGRWWLCLLTLFLLTGCWGRLEVNDLGMGTGLAIDKGKQQAVRVTLYLARGMGGAKGGEPRWTVTREAATISDALHLIHRSSSRRVSLEHLRVILVGEEYARTGMEELLDFIARHYQIRLTSRFLVTRGDASTFLHTQPHLEALLPESVVKILEAKGGLNPRVKEFLVANVAESFSPWLYTLHARPGARDREIEVGGMALFVNERMVDILDQNGTIALSWLLQTPTDVALPVPCADEPERLFAVQVENGKAKIIPSVSGRNVSFQVKGQVTVNLVSSACTKSSITVPSHRALFERQLQVTLTESVQALTKRLQATKADPAGFGKRLQLRYPAFFRANASRWPDLWAQSQVTYALKAKLHHSRLLLEPVNRTRRELRGDE